MFRSILATLLIGIVLFLAPYIGLNSYLHPHIWYILAFFLGVSFLIHRLMEFGMKNNREKFITFYISTIVAKLLMSLVFIGLFLYRGLSDSFLFVINFFALYLFYTSFEIYGLYRNLRRD
jgi:O-antigen/teichoic acid export membrane protein